MNKTPEHKTEIINYIKDHPLAVLGTIGSKHTPHGAAIYTCAFDEPTGVRIYFLTKNSTQKLANLDDRPLVSLTYADESEASTLQVNGEAERLRNEPHTLEIVMNRLTHARTIIADWLPPIAKISEGEYEVVRINVHTARLGRFGKNITVGDPHLFTEL